jgi:hypothetical protein
MSTSTAMTPSNANDDPRRPSQVHKYEAMPQLPEGRRRGAAGAMAQQEPGSLDFLATLSMLLGVGGMATRAKLLVWLSVFACLSAGANLRRSDGDARAVVGAFMYVRMHAVDDRLERLILSDSSQRNAFLSCCRFSGMALAMIYFTGPAPSSEA